MQGVDKLNPPIQYNLLWLIIGASLFLLIAVWYIVALLITRRKKLKSINDLRPLAPLNLDQLKYKYLALIDETYQRHLRQELSLRALHKELSMLVRSFVQEANYLPAPFLTLSDLKMTSYPGLTKLIEGYYPEEFAAMTQGDALASTQAAKGVVTQWPC